MNRVWGAANFVNNLGTVAGIATLVGVAATGPLGAAIGLALFVKGGAFFAANSVAGLSQVHCDRMNALGTSWSNGTTSYGHEGLIADVNARAAKTAN